IMVSVLPQVLPQLTHITIYRWEYHFRASAVLGMVGAGGIGFALMAALRLIKYDEVSAVLLSILACVIVVDSIGPVLRRRLSATTYATTIESMKCWNQQTEPGSEKSDETKHYGDPTHS